MNDTCFHCYPVCAIPEWTCGCGRRSRVTANALFEALRELAVDVAYVPEERHMSLGTLRALWTEIRQFKPSLVHTHLLHGDLYGQAAARAGGVLGIPSFHGVHGFFRREPIRTAEWAAGRFARRTIAISEHVRDFPFDLVFADQRASG